MRVFFDTNVVLDVLTYREPFYGRSVQVWTLAERARIEGLVSILSFANAFYVVRRLNNRAAAHRAVKLLRDTFAPVPLDEQTLEQAIHADLPDFEDALQLFSALRCEADCLVTRNARHFPTDAIPVQTPAEFLATHFPA